MDWAGLIQTLEREVKSTDCVILYSSDIENLSLRKISIWDKGVKKINLKKDLRENSSIKDYAKSLEQLVQGNIYIVDNETDRLSVDTNNELIRTLKQYRKMKERRYGRNLILYEFKK